MTPYYLYQIQNKINNKIYIGITTDPKAREYQHLRKKSGGFSVIRQAVSKYGKESFEFKVLVIGVKDYICDLERSLISVYKKSGISYNIKDGGGVGIGGYSISKRKDDTPLCALGFWFPNVRIALQHLTLNVKTFYARKKAGTLHLEARQLKAVVRPKRNSCEDIKKRSTSMKGKNAGQNNAMFGTRNTVRSRPISIDGVVYPSISEAVRQTVYTKSQIEKRLKKKHPSFKYLNKLN